VAAALAREQEAAPKPRGGSVSPLEEFAEQVLELVAEQPDLTLVETVAELRKRRGRTSRSSLCKLRNGSASDVACARRRWTREQGMFDRARLVFSDETAVGTNMVWLSGRAPRGVDIVVMDNLRAHKVPGIREAIEKARATVRYLLQYSPDLNPIELPYSKFKALLRKIAARTVPGLYRTIRSFIPLPSPQECANYFRHAGYASI
jgi:transposase